MLMRLRPNVIGITLFITMLAAFTFSCKPSKKVVTGQVFIATAGGVVFKLGAVPISVCQKTDLDEYLNRKAVEIVAAKRESENARLFFEAYSKNKGYLNDSNFVAEFSALKDQEAEACKDLYARSNSILSLKRINEDFLKKAEEVQLSLEQLNVVYTGKLNRGTVSSQIRYYRMLSTSLFEGTYTESQKIDVWPDEVDAIKKWKHFLSDLVKTNSDIGRDYLDAKKNLSLIQLHQKELTEKYYNLGYYRYTAADSKYSRLTDRQTLIMDFQPNALVEAVTDSEGNYSLECPNIGGLLLVCNASRVVIGETENYHWLLSIPSEKTKFRLDLNNRNQVDVTSLLSDLQQSKSQ